MLIRPSGRIIGLDHVGRNHRHAGRGGEFSSRSAKGYFPTAGLQAWFDAAQGVTSASSAVSQWNDLSGLSHHLLQASGANQPIYLPYSGTKYGWLPGVSGNYFSTPDSTAASITGDIDIRCFIESPSWDAASYQMFVSKWVGGNSYQFYRDISGKLAIDTSAQSGRLATTNTGFAAGSAHWIRVTRISATGVVKFYTSVDGSTWVQLGADVAGTSGALVDTTATVGVGATNGGGTEWLGKIYRAQIYNGINGTLAVDFNPTRWSSGTTFTASTGETWTINSTGAKPAQIVDRASVLFDGTAHKMAASFTYNQPRTTYEVMRQVTHTVGDVLSDGTTANRGAMAQTTASPKISLNAGSAAAENADAALGSWVVVCTVLNGASSLIQVGTNAATTGDAGAANPGGITLGADGGGLNYGNGQWSQRLDFNVAHDAATRANIIAALKSKWGI